MRVGVLGIGDIARKAYLPVLALRDDVELVLASRDQSAVADAARRFGAVRTFDTSEDLTPLLSADLDAVFVCSATPAHHDQVVRLLDAGMPVHCDKPLALNHVLAADMIAHAYEHNVLLRTGFNRRHIPYVVEAKALGTPSLVLHQKHRVNLPDDARKVVMDDFIHVLDTVRFLLGEHERVDVAGRRLPDGRLAQVSVVLTTGDGRVGHAVMSREAGAAEERLEVLVPGVKHAVSEFVDREVRSSDTLTKDRPGDWSPTLRNRGFEAMVDAFLADVAESPGFRPADMDTLATHELCELVVDALERA